MEVARWRVVFGSNGVLGWAGFGAILSSVTGWISPWRGSTARSSGVTATSRLAADGMRDASPRPNAFLAMIEHLARKVHVAHRSDTGRIVNDDRLAETRRLAQSDVSWDHRVVEPPREIPPGLVHHLLGQIQAIF